MQAIILAAGMGKRLGEYTKDNTKCMLEVNGVKLIDRALENLYGIGVSRVILVVGYKAENVKRYVGDNYKGLPVLYVDNPDYDRTNNIYSFYLAKDYLEQEDTILLESDLIYEPAVLRKLIGSPDENVALVDKYESWMDGTVVTLGEDGSILRFIDKKDFKYDEIKDYYKTVNIYKFGRDFLKRYYIPFLEAYSKAMGNNEYYEQVLRVILHLHNVPVKALPLDGEIWYEIDDVQDLDIATGMFAPTAEEQYKAITSRFGGFWRYPQMLDFCYLVNPFFPTAKMKDEIKASFETLLCEYPSGMKVNSLLAAKNFGIRQEHIAVGNGASELIKALMDDSDFDILGNVIPTFEEYPNRLSRDRVIQFRPSGNGFRYSANDVISFFSGKKIDSLLLINPDNPSGNLIGREGLAMLLEWSLKRGIRLIADESFIDFAENAESISLMKEDILCKYPNLVVIKSISKSYGVPGLRLGVLASGDANLVSRIKKDVSIWNINSFGEFFMQIMEKYSGDYRNSCDAFRKERDRFEKELGKVKCLKVYHSEANFFLCKVLNGMSSAQMAVELLKNGILIKDCSTKPGFDGGNYIRIAIRSEEDNTKLFNALMDM